MKRSGIVKKFLCYTAFAGLLAVFIALSGCEQTPEIGGAGKQDGGNTEEYTDNPFTGSVSSMNTGPMGRGTTRHFTAESYGRPVIWTVEGGSDGGGTVITSTSKFTGKFTSMLTVGNNENSMLLLVKALSDEDSEELGTAAVKVKVWRELTAGLKGLISNRSSGWKTFTASVGNGVASFGIRTLAYGEGVGPGKGRWVVGGGSDRDGDPEGGGGKQDYPVLVYSDDDGETWTETTPALLYQEDTLCIIYDGPPNDKKFILSTDKGNVFWSVDGKKWTKVLNVLPNVYVAADSPNRLWQVIYGDIDRADGGRGRYLVLGHSGRFTWSDDSKIWEKAGDGTKTEADYRYVADCDAMLIQYGTGVINGKSVKMFFGAGHKTNVSKVHCYSLDGINWVILAEDKVAAVAFEPNLPVGANQRILWWLDEADTSLLDFAPDTTIYEYKGQTGTIIESPGVSSHADFVACGNGKYMAVGKGRRLAIGYADVFKK
jgi:hypothetical protein